MRKRRGEPWRGLDGGKERTVMEKRTKATKGTASRRTRRADTRGWVTGWQTARRLKAEEGGKGKDGARKGGKAERGKERARRRFGNSRVEGATKSVTILRVHVGERRSTRGVLKSRALVGAPVRIMRDRGTGGASSMSRGAGIALWRKL